MLIVVLGPSRDRHSLCAEGARRLCSDSREERRNCMRLEMKLEILIKGEIMEVKEAQRLDFILQVEVTEDLLF